MTLAWLITGVVVGSALLMLAGASFFHFRAARRERDRRFREGAVLDSTAVILSQAHEAVRAEGLQGFAPLTATLDEDDGWPFWD